MDLKKYFQESADVKVNFIKNNADKLEEIINLINEAIKNGNEVFQDEKFRCSIVPAIRYVDEVMLSIDQDASVCESIKAAAIEIRKRLI